MEKLKFKPTFTCLECEQKIVEKCRIIKHSKLIKYLISFSKYENEFLKLLILTGKEGFKEIFIDFGRIISNSLKNYNFKDYYLTFVPLTNKKLNKRGFNQSEILAQTIAENLGLKVFSGLIKIKETEDQAKLNLEKRTNNLKDVFVIKETPPKKIILVDDIKTTGTTLKECAYILRKAGAEEILALTILR